MIFYYISHMFHSQTNVTPPSQTPTYTLFIRKDIDECQGPIFPCGTRAKCINTKGTYICECPFPLIHGDAFKACMRESKHLHINLQFFTQIDFFSHKILTAVQYFQ